MKNYFYILIFISFSRQALGQNSPDKTIYGTYESYAWGCCFSCNCATKYVLTFNKDSTCTYERLTYTSPIKGKWWKYTLDEYVAERNQWTFNNDTIKLPEESLIDWRFLLFKNKKLISANDYMFLEIYGKDWLKSNPRIKKRQFKKKRLNLLRNRHIKKHIRHRG